MFVPEEFSGTREDPTLRRDRGPLYAFTMQGLYAVGVAGVALGIARAMLEAFIDAGAATRRRAIWRGWPTTPWCSPTSPGARPTRRGARLPGRDPEGHLGRAPTTSSRSASPDRARVRLGCSQAIHAALEVADWVYKAAGTSAIFLGTPFERRFRDIHTLSQQIQSREAHFETVGRVMLNGDPDGTFLG